MSVIKDVRKDLSQQTASDLMPGDMGGLEPSLMKPVRVAATPGFSDASKEEHRQLGERFADSLDDVDFSDPFSEKEMEKIFSEEIPKSDENSELFRRQEEDKSSRDTEVLENEEEEISIPHMLKEEYEKAQETGDGLEEIPGAFEDESSMEDLLPEFAGEEASATEADPEIVEDTAAEVELPMEEEILVPDEAETPEETEEIAEEEIVEPDGTEIPVGEAILIPAGAEMTKEPEILVPDEAELPAEGEIPVPVEAELSAGEEIPLPEETEWSAEEELPGSVEAGIPVSPEMTKEPEISVPDEAERFTEEEIPVPEETGMPAEEEPEMPSTAELPEEEMAAGLEKSELAEGTAAEPEIPVTIEAEPEKTVIEIEENEENSKMEMKEQNTELEEKKPVDNVTVITKGTRIDGSIYTDGSLEIQGVVGGNATCLGKLSIFGKVQGDVEASEIFINETRLNGGIKSSTTVKIGVGTVVVGNITGTSAVIAGAVRGDIDVNGPVIIDSTAVVQGNIVAKSIQVNNGAIIEGQCSLSYASININEFFEEEVLEDK